MVKLHLFSVMCIMVIFVTAISLYGESQAVQTAQLMTNQELSDKVSELEERIENLEFFHGMHDLRISDLEKVASGQNIKITPRPQKNVKPKVNPNWGLVNIGMTEIEVEALVGVPYCVDAWKKDGYNWKQWNYLNEGYVQFLRAESKQSFGLHVPENEEYTVGGLSSPNP